VVEGGEGALHGVFFDNEGDVVFAGALGDGHDVHVFAAEGGKGAAGNAGDATHVFADGRDDGDVGIGVDVLDGLLGDFGGEGVAEGGDGALFVDSGNEEADVVLGRGLRDEEDVGARGGGGGEAAGEDVGEADDAGATDGDHGDIFDGGEGFDAGGGGVPFRGDLGAGIFGLEAVANPDRDAGGGDGAQCVGMENFGAEIGELGGFVVGDFGDGLGFGDEAGVGGFDAVDVGPDDGFSGVERGAEDGGAVVGTATA